MAENEILDLGHPTRWRRTRYVISSPMCSIAEAVGAAVDDIEKVCRHLAIALRKGAPLSLLLRPALGSPVEAQAVISLFKERRLLSVVQSAQKLAESANPTAIANVAARLLVQGLAEQVQHYAGRKGDSFRSCEARYELKQGLDHAFANYIEPLRLAIETSLRGGRVRAYKSPVRIVPRMTAKEIINLPISTNTKPHQQSHDHQ